MGDVFLDYVRQSLSGAVNHAVSGWKSDYIRYLKKYLTKVVPDMKKDMAKKQS